MNGLQKPAWPAFLLLHGFLLFTAAVCFFRMNLQPLMTEAFYLLLLIWVLTLSFPHRSRLLPLTTFDGFFTGFIILVIASLFLHGNLEAGQDKYATYLPFMAAIPYLCGRLMRRQDVILLSRIVVFAGIGVFALAVLDRTISPDSDSVRWPFFGMAHGTLLVGDLLAATLLMLCVRWACMCANECRMRKNVLHYSAIGIIAAFLVWISARGCLVVVLVGMGVLLLVNFRFRRMRGRYLCLFGFVAVVVSFTLLLIPHPSRQFYAGLLLKPQIEFSGQVNKHNGISAYGPILGKDSCQLLEKNIDSIAIRWVLYQEAMAMFMQKPILGVGAARFGLRSCSGPLGFPHSTILQAFAELGLVGGGLLLALLALVGFKLVGRIVSAGPDKVQPADAYALVLFTIYLMTDQFYGNYFMSAGTYLIAGVAAGLDSEEKTRDLVHA